MTGNSRVGISGKYGFVVCISSDESELINWDISVENVKKWGNIVALRNAC